jgi:uncharacterized protein YndB with AHSA1/START domain
VTAEPARDLTIDRAVTIARPLADVFALFTQRPATWWPLATASYSREQAVDLTFEPRVGGRVYETARDGSEVTWGEILVWDPPHRFAYSYRPFGDGRLTQVEVTFNALSESSTDVRVLHGGWEAHGEEGVKRSEGYSWGWHTNLIRLARAAQEGVEGDAGEGLRDERPH